MIGNFNTANASAYQLLRVAARQITRASTQIVSNCPESIRCEIARANMLRCTEQQIDLMHLVSGIAAGTTLLNKAMLTLESVKQGLIAAREMVVTAKDVSQEKLPVLNTLYQQDIGDVFQLLRSAQHNHEMLFGGLFANRTGSKLQGMPDHSAPISIKVGVSHDDVITVAIPRLLPGQPTRVDDIIPADEIFTPIFPHMKDAVLQKAGARLALQDVTLCCKAIYEGTKVKSILLPILPTAISVNDAFTKLIVNAQSLTGTHGRYSWLGPRGTEVYLLAVAAAKNAVVTATDGVCSEALFKNAITAVLTSTDSYISMETTALDLINIPAYQVCDHVQRLLPSGNKIVDTIINVTKNVSRVSTMTDRGYKFAILQAVFGRAVCFCPADSVLAGDILNAEHQALAENSIIKALSIVNTLAQVISSKLYSLSCADQQLKARIKNLQNILDSYFNLPEVMQDLKNALLSSKIAIFIINQNCRISDNILKLMEA